MPRLSNMGVHAWISISIKHWTAGTRRNYLPDRYGWWPVLPELLGKLVEELPVVCSSTFDICLFKGALFLAFYQQNDYMD